MSLFVVERRVQAAAVEEQTEARLPPPPAPEAAVETPDEWGRLEAANTLLIEDPEAAREALEALYVASVEPGVVQQVALGLVAVGGEGWPEGTQGSFLRRLAPAALVAARESAVPPSITMAQAILESGWGRSGLARDANNLFGMKSGSSPTGYVSSGGSRYAAFESWEDGLRAHNELLSSSRRYAASRDHTDDWNAYLRAIAPVYATSRSYVRLVSDLVIRYELSQWDHLVREARTVAARVSESGEDESLASASPAVTSR